MKKIRVQNFGKPYFFSENQNTMNKKEIQGYLFNGRFYKSLDDLRGKTMSKGNEPKPLYFEDQLNPKKYDINGIEVEKPDINNPNWVHNGYQIALDKWEKEAKTHKEWSEYWKEEEHEARVAFTKRTSELIKSQNQLKALKQEVERLRLEIIDQEIKLQASEERVKQLEEGVTEMLGILKLIRKHDHLLYDEELRIPYFEALLTQEDKTETDESIKYEVIYVINNPIDQYTYLIDLERVVKGDLILNHIGGTGEKCTYEIEGNMLKVHTPIFTANPKRIEVLTNKT